MNFSILKIKNHKFFIVILFIQFTIYFLFNIDLKIVLPGDSEEYIGMVENLFVYGTYEFNGNYSGRMPSFLPIYYPLRLVFSQYASLLILIFLQLILYSYTSVFFIEKISTYFQWNKNLSLFLILLLGSTNYITYWGEIFYTESITVSLLMIVFALLTDVKNMRSKKTTLFVGSLITWIVFLRPFCIVLFIPICLYLLMKLRKESLKMIFILIAPFIFFDSIWAIRNYVNEDRLIILQSSLYAGGEPRQSFLKYRELISKIGGDVCEWNPSSEGHWFQTNEYLDKYNFIRPQDNILPGYIFFDGFTIDSLKKIRSFYWDLKLNPKNKQAEANFVHNVDLFLNDFKNKKPAHYYIIAPLRKIKNFIIQPFTYYIGVDKGFMKYFQIPIKSLIYIINVVIFILGYFSLLFCLKKFIMSKQDYYLLLLMILPFFIIFLFPLYMGLIEYRFQIVAIPSLILCIGVFIDFIEHDLINKYFKS